MEYLYNGTDTPSVDAYDSKSNNTNSIKKTSFDHATSQQAIFVPQQNPTYSLKEVRKLFKTGGYDFDQVVPVQVR